MSALPLIVPQWTVAMPNVSACMTTRSGGTSQGVYGELDGQHGLNLGVHVGDALSAVMDNRARLRTTLPAEPAWLTQVHGVKVLDAVAVVHESAERAADHTAPEADASVTDQANVVCSIMTADCLPVLLADASGKVVAAAHAGWRGLAAGVLRQAVQQMRNMGANSMQAWLGPAIGPAKFEVGEDVRHAFVSHDLLLASAFLPKADKSGKYLADIYALARAMLAEEGVTMVTGGDTCTVSDPERFYSFRRDGVTGRMAALIWKTA